MPFKRLFLALPPDDSARADLVDLQHEIHLENVRKTPAPNLHVTVKFLGETPDEEIPGLIEAMGLMVQETEPFEVTIDHVDYLPNIQRPRVLAAMAPRTEPLMRLFHAIEEAADACGYRREGRPFNPHITLGRFGRGRKPGPLPAPDTFGPIESGFTVQRLSLMQSLLEPDGPTYVDLAEFRL